MSGITFLYSIQLSIQNHLSIEVFFATHLSIELMDALMAYLYGPLDLDLNMTVPIGISIPTLMQTAPYIM